MNIILASRGMFNQATHELLRTLPLTVSCVVAMSISLKRRPADIDSLTSFMSLLESEGICYEEIVKKGILVDEVSSTAISRNADIIILVEEPARPVKSRVFASDGLAVLKKSGKPVLLQSHGCVIRNTGSILITMSGVHQSPESQWSLENILQLAGREAIVLSVSSPYYPVFGEVAAGMHSYHSEALKEIGTEQASEASIPAELITHKLKEAGAKSWFISRTGKFVNEIHKITQSADISLVCVLIDPAVKRRWLGKSELTDLLEAVTVPVILVPCERIS